MSKNEDSDFNEKLKLLLIDKLLLGGGLAAFAFFIQCSLDQRNAELSRQQIERDSRAAHEQRIQDATLAVSKVVTEVVDVHCNTLSRSVRDLLSIVEKSESEGRVRNEGDRARLRKIGESIEYSLNQLASVDPDLASTSDPFVKRIHSIRSDLVNRSRSPEDLQKDATCLLKTYSGLLTEIRRTRILALDTDRKAVIEILSHDRMKGN